MPQIDPSGALSSANVLHIIITLSLFAINGLLTTAIGHDTAVTRLNYLGHEMVYLAAAIVASHVFVEAFENPLIPLVAVFPYLAVWVFTLILTKRVIEVGVGRFHPLTGATLIFGVVAVYFSLTSRVEFAVAQLLAHVGE